MVMSNFDGMGEQQSYAGERELDAGESGIEEGVPKNSHRDLVSLGNEGFGPVDLEFWD